jgi:hypothetical protein
MTIDDATNVHSFRVSASASSFLCPPDDGLLLGDPGLYLTFHSDWSLGPEGGHFRRDLLSFAFNSSFLRFPKGKIRLVSCAKKGKRAWEAVMIVMHKRGQQMLCWLPQLVFLLTVTEAVTIAP